MASYLSVLIQAAEPANYKLNYDEHYMISVPFATTTTPGIASFDSDYFKVENGVVSLSDEYAGELSNIIDRLDEVEGDITDLENGKVDKIAPENYGTYAYAVRTDIIDGVINFIFPIASVASANTIVVRNANGRIKIANGANSDEAVTLSQLVAATTNIPESALSVDVRTKLNKIISRVGITPADWQALPVADRDINTCYFVGPYGTAPNQYFVEWMYFVDTNNIGTWEALGSTLAVDLSNYFTKSEINALLAGKANIDGVYSGMSVGHADIADQINTDREIDNAEEACPPVIYGTVGGNAEVQSGLMPFTELRGHTIKWNQLFKNGNFDGTTDISSYQATISASDNELSVTYSGGYWGQGNIPFVSGHKYLFKFDCTAKESTTTRIGLFNSGAVIDASWQSYSAGLNSFVWTATVTTSNGQVFLYGESGKTDKFKNVMWIDVTETDYTTVTEFVRDFPMPYYPYNAGTLLSSKSSSVDFVKRNQWDEEWEAGILNSDGSVSSGSRVVSKNYIPVLPGATYFFTVVNGNNYVGRYALYDADKNLVVYSDDSTRTLTIPINATYLKFCTNAGYGSTYLNDICIYINWETPNLPYVSYSKQTITLPNIELQSAGSAYDVLYQQGGGKRRISSVDLGTIDWGFVSTTDYEAMYSTGLASLAKHPASDGTLANILCVLFDTVTRNQQYNHISDGIIAVSDDGTLYVYSSTMGTDASAFKTAMSGVMLYYELATETDITVEENPGWTEYAEIDNFGTVKFNQDPAQDIPVPQAYFVRYTVNLVEFLDSLYVHCGGDVTKIALTS